MKIFTRRCDNLFFLSDNTMFHWRIINKLNIIQFNAAFGDQPTKDPVFTCSNKQDASTQEDVVPAVVNSSYSHTHSSQQQQYSAQDGEKAGCSHNPYTNSNLSC